MVKKSKHSPKSILSELQTKGKKYKGNEFWQTDDKGNRKIKPTLLQEFLIANGFRREKGKIGRLIEGIFIEMTPQQTFNYCLSYVKRQNDNKLTDAFLTQGETLLITKKAVLNSLPELKSTRCKDTKISSFKFYLNGIIKVKKSKIKVLGYKWLKEKNLYIREKQIIPRNYDIKTSEKSDFEKFLRLVTNSNKHFLSACSSIGYCLHGYKDESNAKIIILSDTQSQVTKKPHGRSGKGLITKAISKLILTDTLNGKNLSLKNDKFAFENATEDTALVIFQDTQKGFDVEQLFSLITDDFIIERKYISKIVVPFKDSSKFLATTNYPIIGNSDSYIDRIHLVLLNNYFNAHHKPKDEFKKLFFIEWSDDEYKAFDKFMVGCLQLFLKEGLLSFVKPELELPILARHTSDEFIKLMESEFSTTNKYFLLKDVSSRLKTLKMDNRNKGRTVSTWVKEYAQFKGYDIKKGKIDGITKMCFVKSK